MTSENATVCLTTMADAPLQVGRRVGPTEWRRMTQEQVNQFAEVTAFEKGVQVNASFTVEVKDAAKPALVAECLFRYYR